MQYGNLFIGGDFKLVSDPKLDTTTSKPNGTASLHTLLHTEELFDAWRCLRANKRNYTFFSTRHCSYSHIDMFLTDIWLLQCVHATLIHNITWSDHTAISLSIAKQGVSPPSPISCCNVRYLQETQTLPVISQHLQDFL